MLKKFLFAGTFALLFAGCETKQNSSGVDFNEIDEADLKEKIEEVVFTMPSPTDAATNLKEIGAMYMPEILNSPNSYENYLTSTFKTAVNLGVYAADLGYTCVYFQNISDAISYIKASKKLSINLGILGSFEVSMIKRFESNIASQDSALAIIAENFTKSEEYLKKNQRDNIAALVIAGSWIEGLYLSTEIERRYEANVPQDIKNQILKPIKEQVGRQKESLSKLIVLLEKFKDDEKVNELIEKLKTLLKIYDSVKMEIEEPAEQGAKNIVNIEISDETFKAISETIKEIRTSIVL